MTMVDLKNSGYHRVRTVQYPLFTVRWNLLIRLKSFWYFLPSKESKWIRNRFKIFINTCSCLKVPLRRSGHITRRVLHARKSELGALCINRMIIRHGWRNERGLLKRELRENLWLRPSDLVWSTDPYLRVGQTLVGFGYQDIPTIEYPLCGMLWRLSKLLEPRVI